LKRRDVDSLPWQHSLRKRKRGITLETGFHHSHADDRCQADLFFGAALVNVVAQKSTAHTPGREPLASFRSATAEKA
jgi:hypothetical protein